MRRVDGLIGQFLKLHDPLSVRTGYGTRRPLEGMPREVARKDKFYLAARSVICR
jgi:exopolysaccharide biosynthesis protein